MLCPNRGGLLKKTQYCVRSKKLKFINSPLYQFQKPKNNHTISLQEVDPVDFFNCYQQKFIFSNKELIDEPGVENCWVHLTCILWQEELNLYEKSLFGLSKINPVKIKSLCQICKIPQGLVQFCHHEGCDFCFHIECA